MQLDFAKLRDSIPIADVASMLGLRLTEKNGQLVGACPINGGTNATAFKLTPEKNRFVCFCSECRKLPKQGGDVIELVSRIRKVGHRDAAAQIAAHFGGAGKAADNAPPPPEAKEDRKPAGFDPREYQRKLDPDHYSLIPYGVTADTIRAFGGGFCSKGLMVGRLTLPIYKNGEPFSFFGIGMAVPHDLKAGKDCPDVFAPPELHDEEDVPLVDHPLKVLKAYDDGANALCVLKPMTWGVLTSLAEFCKERDVSIST